MTLKCTSQEVAFANISVLTYEIFLMSGLSLASDVFISSLNLSYYLGISNMEAQVYIPYICLLTQAMHILKFCVDGTLV